MIGNVILSDKCCILNSLVYHDLDLRLQFQVGVPHARLRDRVLLHRRVQLPESTRIIGVRDGEVPSQKELSSYFEELFSSKVPRQKELSSQNEELFPNPIGVRDWHFKLLNKKAIAL